MNTFAPPKERSRKQAQPGKKLEISFDERKATSFVPFLLFLTLLGVIYIGNNYYSDSMIRKTNVMQRQVDEMRIDYGSVKYEFMYSGKKAEILKKVRGLGLVERDKPVYRIKTDEK